VELGFNCPPDESKGWNSMLSPGAIVAAGLLALFQPKWL
jgi:hypothetical protein